MTVTPAPKFAVLEAVKEVYWPVTVMLAVAPWASELGLTLVMTGVPAVTVKALLRDATWPPVVIVAVYAPTVAVGLMAMLAVAEVGLLMVSVEIVIPVPRLNVEVPWRKFVPDPTMATLEMF